MKLDRFVSFTYDEVEVFSDVGPASQENKENAELRTQRPSTNRPKRGLLECTKTKIGY